LRRKRRSRISSRSILFPAAITAILVVGIVLIAVSRAPEEPLTTERPSPPPGVKSIEVLKSGHVETEVSYDVTPPVGGPHHPIPMTCGVYDEPVRTENAVHSMEHGAVWITYQPSLKDKDLTTVRKLAGERVLISPWADLKYPVVASAWGRQLRLQSVNESQLRTFVEAFANGPQSPEPGAPCQGLGPSND
jgi:hypothetical protein